MRPIDADTVLPKIDECLLSSMGRREAIITCYYAVKEAPTIDVKPVIHAHWIEKTDWCHGIGRIHCTCSNCGYTVDYKPGSRGDGRGGKFCDDCGAIMDEKSETK